MKKALAIACMLGTVLVTRPVLAQSAAYGSQTVPSAQAVADDALECLKRGEDATSKEIKRKEYTRGLELGKQAVALDDRNPDAHFAVFANNGRLMLLDGVSINPINLLRANDELEKCLDLDPNHADALAAKGGLYRQLPRLLGGNLNTAETLLTRSIALDPNSIGGRIELAATYRDKGDSERGIPLLHKAIAIAEEQGKKRQLGEAKKLLSEIQTSY